MKLLQDITLGTLFSLMVIIAIAYAPDIRGAGQSENAFLWQEGTDQTQISVPYSLSGHPLVIRSEEGKFLLINPSPQKQFLRVISPEGQYRIRHRMPITVPVRTGFWIETVSLTDSTVTASFEAQAI